MADFSMAIINACVCEFTGETVQGYLTRGYDIINGDARKEDAEKNNNFPCMCGTYVKAEQISHAKIARERQARQ